MTLINKSLLGKTLLVASLVLGLSACTLASGIKPGFLPPIPSPTPTAAVAQPSQTAEAVDRDEISRAEANLVQLESANVPESRLEVIAEKYTGKSIPSPYYPDSNAPYSIGARKSFYVGNQDTNETFQVYARLVYRTDHAYFWVEENVAFDQAAAERLINTFEEKIYPTNRKFFGSEWTPGIDGDEHIYILYVRDIGSQVAGVFSSGDSVHPDASKYSNAHEIFVLNARTIGLDEDFTYGVLAHEFQHMIHWANDRNEDSWIEEGFSELASYLNGYSIGGHDYSFVVNPDIQLNYWPSEASERSAHYGASFLFVAYFLERFGVEATQALVANPLNGLVNVDDTLAALKITDRQTGEPITANEFFRDWTLTNFLMDSALADGRYAYNGYTSVPRVRVSESVTACPIGWQSRQVAQYGADYIQIACPGSFMLEVHGSAFIPLWPAEAKSGRYVFWSNKGDDSNMTLSRSFDFRSVKGPITLRYQTWYDIETDYDYVYLLVKVEGGGWTVLRPPACTTKDLSGNNLACGYNGQSGGWIEQQVDLSAFAGKQVTLQFEYVTDPAVNGEGLLLDDVSIPEIGYQEDFENGAGGWVGEGFVRVERNIPQHYLVTLIERGKAFNVRRYAIRDGETLRLAIQNGGDVSDTVLVISGVTRHTSQPANYEFQIQK